MLRPTVSVNLTRYASLCFSCASSTQPADPSKVLLDSQILEDAYRTKTDLQTRLEGVLQGKVKLMVTQCDMRHLYDAKPKNNALIESTKNTTERRRCGHHELEEPLSSLECLSSVVDPKSTLTNKHRYVVASQDIKVRAHMRKIAGVPLVYINRSVVIMEPMNTVTEEQRDREEKSKFRLGLKAQRNPAQPPKRKRDEEEGVDDVEEQVMDRPQKKNKRKGPKEPNPLSMKKAKKDQAPPGGNATKPRTTEPKSPRPAAADKVDATTEGEGAGHRKRKRKHKPKGEGDSGVNVDGEANAA